jgi:phosphoglycerol transferase MdoB-like AlkP superfamily enzyme
LKGICKRIGGFVFKEPDEWTGRKAAAGAFCNRFALPLHFLASVIIYFLIEAMARHSIREALVFVDERTKVFFYNACIIFVTSLPVFFFKRRSFFRVLISVFWLFLGVSNGVLLLNRVTPLTGPDLGMFAEMNAVIGKYFDGFEVVLVSAGIIFILLWLLRLFFRAPKFRQKRNFCLIIPGFFAACLGLYGLTVWGLNTRQLSSYFSNIASAYLDYGFPYSLSVTVFDTGISEPNGYSAEMVQSIVKAENNPETTVRSDDMPNILIVQLESFFDPDRVRWLNFSEDPLPNWHKLSKEYSSGLYTVPTVGAGTVNTEFETLTGMSLRFFGPGEYPYKGILRKETCESAATALSGLGYTTHAVHDNTATFYGRRIVYSYLGFNSFTSSEYMDTQDDVNENDWMRDENLISPINDALDSTTNRDFVFTVSVQPHGAYPTEPVIDDPAITVSGAGSDSANCEWEYYVNQIHEEDQFVADLISDISERGEPTVVLFYGDHLPTMGLDDSDLNQGTTFDTNYLIWDNLGLDASHQKLKAYQAVAELFNRLDIHEGTMFRFQQTMKNKESYLLDMQTLQYDILYGSRYVYGQTNPFSKSVLAMGVKPITVSSIEPVGSGGYYITGENFTQSCKLQINDKAVETTYIDSTRLYVREAELKNGDWVNVAVQANSSSHMTLSTSNTLIYGTGRLANGEQAQDTTGQNETAQVTPAAEATPTAEATPAAEATPTPETAAAAEDTQN